MSPKTKKIFDSLENDLPEEEKDRVDIDTSIPEEIEKEYDSLLKNIFADDFFPAREKNDKDYWTEETEAAVIEFLFLNELFFETMVKSEHDEAKKGNRPLNKAFCLDMEKRKQKCLKIKDREKIRSRNFKENVRVPLNRLIENIIFNYKLFRADIDVKTLHRDCVGHVYTKFTNFNPWQHTKSFSYFGTIAKNYLMGGKKDHDKFIKTNTGIEYAFNDIEEIAMKHADEGSDHLEQSLTFFNFILQEIENEINKGSWSNNDIKVGDSIAMIFKNHEELGLYNKNELYQQIKIITGLETKDITYSLHRLRVFYKSRKQEFIKKNKD